MAGSGEVSVGDLPRPELPPGAQRDLVAALHALHHEAGWPSLRALAREAGCFAHRLLDGVLLPRLPYLGVLEPVVEAMGGDTEEFRRVWVAATGSAAPGQVAARITGRRSDLAVSRRHLESSNGLLLVVGEAGIGKSRLVETAESQAHEVLVAKGACLPLSAQVPLLPVTDALRHLFEADGGQRFKEALADCPLYVGPALCRLLPELDDLVPAPPVPDDGWWRQRLFSAVGALLSALATARPTAVLLEDLHWRTRPPSTWFGICSAASTVPTGGQLPAGRPGYRLRDRRLAGAGPAAPGGDHDRARAAHPGRERRAAGTPRRVRVSARDRPDSPAFGRTPVRRAARAVGGPCHADRTVGRPARPTTCRPLTGRVGDHRRPGHRGSTAEPAAELRTVCRPHAARADRRVARAGRPPPDEDRRARRPTAAPAPRRGCTPTPGRRRGE